MTIFVPWVFFLRIRNKNFIIHYLSYTSVYSNTYLNTTCKEIWVVGNIRKRKKTFQALPTFSYVYMCMKTHSNRRKQRLQSADKLVNEYIWMYGLHEENYFFFK